jgi:hypothetical protein
VPKEVVGSIFWGVYTVTFTVMGGVRMKWVRYEKREEQKKCCQNFSGKLEVKEMLWRCRQKWEDNIVTCL